FFGYKLPKKVSQEYPGTSFLYVDSRSENWGEEENINSSKCAVSTTLQQYYDNKRQKEIFYIFYNDQFEAKKSKRSHKGHAKGVALFGGQSGFWLVHSVPQFPSISKYYYVKNGEVYGQSFLCVSMNTKSVRVILEAMKYIQPNIYNERIPDYLKTEYAILKKMLERKKNIPKLSNNSLVQKFLSKGGESFISFSKNGKFGSDLYANLIAVDLKSSLFAETWLNGGAVDLPSDCNSQYKVINIEQVKIEGKTFNNSADHSKWAVGDNESLPVVCIADINRQDSQTKRGGGAICTLSKNIWKLYRELVRQLQSCSII
ncbi:unnamed protein product, partial [Thelazia callipaeda]|uniref:Deoxyribonuclease II n=1 Tax=Thelazia callipaeda TaxID=103827 RepID=A0A0N5CS66_THECL